jgi:hypothetical protein
MRIKCLKPPRVNVKLFACILGSIFTINVLGQKSNSFKIDSARINLDENLDGFLTDLKSGKFVESNEIGEIPVGIKRQLDSLAGGFSIANPNGDYRCCCTSSEKLPLRKLVYLSKSNHLLVMTYLTGGVGVSTHILLIRFKGDTITDMWFADCLADLKSRAEIIRYINKNRKVPGYLHPNLSL